MRLLATVVTGALLAACNDPLAVQPRSMLDGEWVFTTDIEKLVLGTRCGVDGHFIVRPTVPGTFEAFDDAIDLCGIEAGDLTSVVVTDTLPGTIAEFRFTTHNCTVSGRFVGEDSLTGSLTCTVPFLRAGTWAAGRATQAASIAITPATRTLAAGATLDMGAVVRDADGRRLFGRAPVWSVQSGSAATVTVANGVATVRAVSSGSATVRAMYETLEATTTVVVSSPVFTEITAGSQFTCALTATQEAWCWGANHLGQLGDGTRAVSRGPVRTAGGVQLSTIDAGSVHSCGVSAAAIYCWGSNTSGLLGVGDTTRRDAPARVSGTTAFAQVSAGSSHTCAADLDQTAWCWGANYSLQLGTLTSYDRHVPTRLQSQPVAMSRLYAGGSHSCALTPSGGGHCWGLGNGTGVLGIGAANSDTVPHSVAGGHAWSSMSTGDERMCALTTSGAAYCWGLRPHGMYMPGDSIVRSPEAVMSGRTFSAISTSGQHICALDAGDGSAWCWGNNSYGQLGNASTTWPSAPVPVSGGLSFTRIAVGTNHTCAIATTGSTYCWGRNEYGQLGDGTTTDRLTPVKVVGQP